MLCGWYRYHILLFSKLLLVALALRHPPAFRLSNYGSKYSSLAAKYNENRVLLEVPECDKEFEYCQFVLPNGILTTIVRHPFSEKSSGSLAVRVGAQDDPMDRQGLAHFTEHAVFLGSQKFPVERAYKEYLSKNGGRSNAGTGMESTTYKFEVNVEAFSDTLDIFSQFFKEPLFTREAIGREVMAVDAEDSKNRILDGRRVVQVMKNLMISSHPFTKFSTGNVQTLADGDAEQNAASVSHIMRCFHSYHYRPENMVLSLVGPQKLEELKELAITMFSDIQPRTDRIIKETETFDKINKNAASSQFLDINALHASNSAVYPFQNGNIIVKVKPVKDIRDVSIMWSLPPTRALYRSNPCRLISHILSHKGSNSTFAALQDKGWASSTSAGTSIEYVDFAIYEMSVSLTASGFDNWDKVIEIIYAQLRNIESMSDSDLLQLWNEIKTASAIDFRYRAKATAYELAPQLAANMLKYPPNHIISAGWLLDDLNIELFRDFVGRLVPNRAITLIRSRSFSWIPDDNELSHVGVPDDIRTINMKKEPWYGVPYHQEDTPELYQCIWEDARRGKACSDGLSALSIPSLNPYICYELKNAELPPIPDPHQLRSSPPTLLSSHFTSPRLSNSVWHSRDEVFGQPKSIFHFLLHSRGCADGHPENSLLASVFNQVSARNLYDAAIAGLEYSVGVGIRGLGVTLYGYSPRLSSLATRVVREFGSLSFWEAVDPDIVANCKERMLRGLQSWVKDRPDSQCDMLLSYLFQENVWLPIDRIRAAELITKETLLSRVQSLLSYSPSRTTSYYHGDLSSQSALGLNMECNAALSASASISNPTTVSAATEACVDAPSRARILPAGHRAVALPCFNSDDINSALVVHIQMGSTSPRTTALLMFMQSLMGEPLFSELRTKKQLGYIVSLSVGGYGRAPGSLRGLTVRLLSNRFSPLLMQAELGKFFRSQEEVFYNLTEEDVRQRAASITKGLLDPPTSYSEEASNFWDAIITGLPFDWTTRVIKELEALTPTTVQEVGKAWLFDPASRCSIALMLFGNNCLQELERLKEQGSMGEHASDFFPPPSAIVTSEDALTALRDSLELFDEPSFDADA